MIDDWQPSSCRGYVFGDRGVYFRNRWKMRPDDLKRRTRAFGIGVVRFVESQRMTAFVVNARGQVIRSATSVGANYGEACRSRSKKEFISKVELVLQELEETRYWLEVLGDYGCSNSQTLAELVTEVTELIAIMAASVLTAKRSSMRSQ